MSQSISPTANHNAPAYHIEHLLILAITVIFGAISATAVFYHVSEIGTFEGPFTMVFSALGAAFAFGMAILPAALAKPHGQAIEGANAQGSLILVVMMVMIVDGSLQWHAVSVIAEALQMQLPPWWALVMVIAAFQVSMFMARGALAASTSEQREMLVAEAQRTAAIESRERIERMKAEADQAEREEKNRIRREQYAAKKEAEQSGKVVNLR
ncbi:MAG TPA: hypothetical protein PLR76_12255 [Hyphomonas sp.]|nr:hypothetical protein [Hyphomonas sp.]